MGSRAYARAYNARMRMRMEPKRWYSWDYSIMSGDRRVAQVDLSAWRERGEIVIGDVTHRVFREPGMVGDFVIEAGGRELARATKPSAFRQTIIIHYGGREYTLRKPSLWRREFVLMDDERQIASIAPEHAWTRRAIANFERDWPMPIQAFAIWLVLILWKREHNAAA
jgi:hypothetical protein